MSFVNNEKGKRFNMEKKIPRNPKYDHVRSNLDTGASMSRYMRKIEDIRQNYKFQKNEIFKRMKLTTFIQLLIQVERLKDTGNFYDDMPETPTGRPDTACTADLEVKEIQEGLSTPAPSIALTDGDFGYQEPQTNRSTLLSVARGLGEMDIRQPQAPVGAQKSVDNSSPYLLLDVRDIDEYDVYHIITAYCYPKATLSRATNYETSEMLTFKNKEGKIIVVYDEDERIAPNVATTLVQRGYDNLFLLSGGLKVAYKHFPDGLMTGTPPPSITGQKLSEFKPALQKSFTADDIDRVEMHLDGALQSKSAASRLSQPMSRNSRASNASSRRSNVSSVSSVNHRKPFLPT